MRRKLLLAAVLTAALRNTDSLAAQVDFEWTKAGAQVITAPLFLGQQAFIHEIGHCIPMEILGDCERIKVNPFTSLKHGWVGATWGEVDNRREGRIVTVTPHFMNVGLIVGGDLMFRSLVSTDSWIGWYTWNTTMAWPWINLAADLWIKGDDSHIKRVYGNHRETRIIGNTLLAILAYRTAVRGLEVFFNKMPSETPRQESIFLVLPEKKGMFITYAFMF